VTATKTPNLGLISPTTTDDFKTTDFAETFGILDLNPGIFCVANQASRPTTWTEKQHGRTCRQMDQLIDWVWVQPTSGSTGIWKRTAGKGVLYTQTTSGAVSSAATVYTAGATVIQTPSIILPGGRPIKVTVRWDTCGNTSGIGVGSYWEGSSLINSRAINGYDYPSNQWARLGLGGQFFAIRDIAPTTQVSVAFRWTISAYALSGTGGTTTTRGTVMVVEEV
jgi:hypothetical protein